MEYIPLQCNDSVIFIASKVRIAFGIFYCSVQ